MTFSTPLPSAADIRNIAAKAKIGWNALSRREKAQVLAMAALIGMNYWALFQVIQKRSLASVVNYMTAAVLSHVVVVVPLTEGPINTAMRAVFAADDQDGDLGDDEGDCDCGKMDDFAKHVEE